MIYQIYPRSFLDSTGRGIGDLKGVTMIYLHRRFIHIICTKISGIQNRLDYLCDIGVDAIWLSPIYTSPMEDFGYDVADYYTIDPLFGTMDDFDELLVAVHERGFAAALNSNMQFLCQFDRSKTTNGYDTKSHKQSARLVHGKLSRPH